MVDVNVQSKRMGMIQRMTHSMTCRSIRKLRPDHVFSYINVLST